MKFGVNRRNLPDFVKCAGPLGGFLQESCVEITTSDRIFRGVRLSVSVTLMVRVVFREPAGHVSSGLSKIPVVSACVLCRADTGAGARAAERAAERAA